MLLARLRIPASATAAAAAEAGISQHYMALTDPSPTRRQYLPYLVAAITSRYLEGSSFARTCKPVNV